MNTLTRAVSLVSHKSEQVGVRRHQPLPHLETYAQALVCSHSWRQPCAGSKSLKSSGSSAQYSSEVNGKMQPEGGGGGGGAHSGSPGGGDGGGSGDGARIEGEQTTPSVF